MRLIQLYLCRLNSQKTYNKQTIIHDINIETKHNHLPRKEVVKYIVTELKL